MKKWVLPFVAAAVTCGSLLPVMADTTSNPANDHAYLYSNVFSPTVGSSAELHINFSGTTTTSTTLQVETTLGTLNGQGSTVTVTPDASGTIPTVSLTSTATGQATVSVYEGGVQIGSTQVTFSPGALGNITIQPTPSNPVVGGTTTLMINATDIYGNPVQDNTLGTTFNISTTAGQLAPFTGINPASNGTTVSISTHNGVASAILTDFTVGTATVTVTETYTLPAGVKINGNTGTNTVNIPINFTYAQSASISPVQDFRDTAFNRPAIEQASERELYEIGVLHGDPNHYYFPNAPLKRSEFAQIVAQYMGLGAVASNLSGTQTKFTDVDTSAWYDGVVAADAALGYIHGDGTKFYPNNSITYAEVAMVLLNNLGASVTGKWPDNAISGGQSYGLFNGLSSFNASAPATRGDVAIMVRNALHLVPPAGGLYTNGKTLESEMLGYTWYGDDQQATVTAIPGTGLNVGNEVQVQTATQATTLHLANSVQMAGASSLSDLMNKKIKYLTNAMGLVTYIEVTL